MATRIIPRKIMLFGFTGEVSLPPHTTNHLPPGIASLFYNHDVFDADLTVFAPDPLLFSPPHSKHDRYELIKFISTQLRSTANPKTFENWRSEDKRERRGFDAGQDKGAKTFDSDILIEYGLWALDQMFLGEVVSPQYVVIFLPRESTEPECTAPIWNRWMGFHTPHQGEENLSRALLTPEAEKTWIADVLNPAALFEGRLPTHAEPVQSDDQTYGLHYCYHRFAEWACTGVAVTFRQRDNVGERIRRNTDHQLSFPWESSCVAEAPMMSVVPLLVSPDGTEVLGLKMKLNLLEVFILPEVSDIKSAVAKLTTSLFGLNTRTEGNKPQAVAQVDTSAPFGPPYPLDVCQRAKKDVEARLKKLGVENQLIGDSEAILQLYPKIKRAADNPKYNVLIYGEIGSGKEELCKLLSHFSAKPDIYVAEEAEAITSSESLMRSRLFGIRKGMATGVDANVGLLELASGGTFILDGMERASTALQKILRRVFDPDNRKYRVDGDRHDTALDCRLVGLFNLPPAELITKGTLLPDFWQRFEIKICIPPLRERKDDIPRLVEVLVKRHMGKTHSSQKISAELVMPPADLIKKWQKRDWSGIDANVRGLRDVVNQFVDSKIEEFSIIDTSAGKSAGRPKGKTDIADTDLVALLRRIGENSSSLFTITKLFDEIDLLIKKRKPGAGGMTRTMDAILRRINRIGDEALLKEASTTNPKKLRRHLVKDVKSLKGFFSLPKSGAPKSK